MENIAKEVKAFLYDRAADKFFSSYVFFFVALNAAHIAAGFRMFYDNSLLDYFQSEFIFLNYGFKTFLFPLACAFVYIIIQPLLKWLSVWYTENINVRTINTKNQIHKKVLLTEDQSMALKNELEKKDKKHSLILTDFQNKNNQYRDAFSQFYSMVMVKVMQGAAQTSDFANNIFNKKNDVTSGSLAIYHYGFLITIEEAAEQKLNLDTTKCFFVIAVFSDFAIAATYGSRFYILNEDFLSHFDRDILKQNEYKLIDLPDFYKNKLNFRLHKYSDNIYDFN